MTDDVKGTRRYDSPRRRAQAAETRRQILAAAGRLFAAQGYAATSMAAIAAEAGVALKTVYVAFETKSGVLRALWNVQLRGDDEAAPIGDREWYRAVLAEHDPDRQLEAAVRASVAVKVRVGSVVGVIRSAAPVDADSAALWARIEQEFYENQRGIVEALAAKGALREGLDVGRATDILWSLNHPDLWLLLVGRRGWTPAEFERWFLATVRAQLLGREVRSGSQRVQDPVASFRNPSFGRIVDAALKQTAAALRDADIPFCLVGSLAVWARGGPESSHDLDFGVRECDLVRAAEALEAEGMTIEIPPEDWLVKAWLGEPGTEDSVLVDLIYGASGLEITDEVLARADVLDVLAHRMPVMNATDILMTKLLSLREQHLDYTATIATARAVREQVDWEALRARVANSPYALAFFTMAEGLGICPVEGATAPPVDTFGPLSTSHGTSERPHRRELAERLAARADQGGAVVRPLPSSTKSAQTAAWSEA